MMTKYGYGFHTDNDADDDDILQRHWKRYGKKGNDDDDKNNGDDDKENDDDDCDVKEQNNVNDGQEDGITRVIFNTSNTLT